MAKLILSSHGDLDEPEFHLAKCTAREVLAIAMPGHDRKNHSLAYVEREGKGDHARLRFRCYTCAGAASFSREAIKEDYGCTLGELWSRLETMGYARGSG